VSTGTWILLTKLKRKTGRSRTDHLSDTPLLGFDSPWKESKNKIKAVNGVDLSRRGGKDGGRGGLNEENPTLTSCLRKKGIARAGGGGRLEGVGLDLTTKMALCMLTEDSAGGKEKGPQKNFW